jgi:hypothetical protein
MALQRLTFTLNSFFAEPAMKSRSLTIAFVTCFAIGFFSLFSWQRESRLPSAQAQTTTAVETSKLEALAAEVERLKQIVPDQSHAMHDVDYHFTNLWFAARHSNWPLAQFYFNETRAHLRWAVRIIPIRKDKAGQEIKLADILQALENSPLKQVEDAIKAQDKEKFEAAYKFTLTGCYACHKAADKPYLRPHIPERPATNLINPDPTATWPQ